MLPTILLSALIVLFSPEWESVPSLIRPLVQTIQGPALNSLDSLDTPGGVVKGRKEGITVRKPFRSNVFTVDSRDISISLDASGTVTRVRYNKTGTSKNLLAYTAITGFRKQRTKLVGSADQTSCSFAHEMYSDSLKRTCTLLETFRADSGSIRWNVAIKADGAPFSPVISSVVQYPATRATRFWTTWGEPQFDSAKCSPALLHAISPYRGAHGGRGWMDPLVPVPFSNAVMYYGAPPFEYGDVKAGFIPFEGNLFAIPLLSIFEKDARAGLSVVASPEDEIINLLIATEVAGKVSVDRCFNKLGAGRTFAFSLDLVAHASEPRAALAWFAQRYPGFIEPKSPGAAALGGTAAYSNFFDDFDAEKMRKMAFTVNWQASFDFPYMGMFLPPVADTAHWERFGGGRISMAEMNDYAGRMKDKGFYVLNYFNVTEFGSSFRYPCPPPANEELWTDGSRFLCAKFPNALLKVPDHVSIAPSFDSLTVHGGPWYSWKRSVVTDCGDSAYREFLLAQAERHIRAIPNSFGICIDRLDWLRFFNEDAADGISWFDNKPVRSLVTSWKQLMAELGPLMHTAGKSILVNNHYKRVDLLEEVDGILDEFTDGTAPLNTTAFLTLKKPALGWTPGKEVIEVAGGDNFFQKYLYLGVFPMCPFPGNDHALRPDSMVDRLYLDYGPLMNQLKEKKWILQGNVVKVKNELAKANIFKTRAGYAIPIVYGRARTITLELNYNLLDLPGKNFVAYYPGQDRAVKLSSKTTGATIRIQVPLLRGAAMVTIAQ